MFWRLVIFFCTFMTAIELLPTAMCFWVHVGMMVYANFADCGGYNSLVLLYAILAFVFGWVTFILAYIGIIVTPRKSGCFVTTALMPTAALFVWGMEVLWNTGSSSTNASCLTGRCIIVGGLCALFIIQLLGFCLFFTFESTRKMAETRFHSPSVINAV